MLRVRVEIVPWGQDWVDPIDVVEVWAGNDATGPRDEDGHMTHGNYDVYMSKDGPSIGRIEGLERVPEHRIELAARMLRIAADAALLEEGTPPC